MDNIYAERIAIEIKAGSTPREILRRFVIREEDNFDAIVFILASKRQSVIKETISSQKCRIYFIFKEDLVNNNDIRRYKWTYARPCKKLYWKSRRLPSGKDGW